MAADLPPELQFLGNATDPAAREDGWSRFVAQYTRLLMKASAEFGGGYDDRMNRYRFVLESLRQDDYRRLRAYRSMAGGSVAAWLVVVARRLCLDHERREAGRPRSREATEARQSEWRLRRALARGGAAEFDPGDRLPAGDPSPDERLRGEELRRALDAALRRLEPRVRLALRLRYEDELSVAEIGALLGLGNVFQVYRILRSALDTVRDHLRQAGFDGPNA